MRSPLVEKSHFLTCAMADSRLPSTADASASSLCCLPALPHGRTDGTLYVHVKAKTENKFYLWYKKTPTSERNLPKAFSYNRVGDSDYTGYWATRELALQHVR